QPASAPVRAITNLLSTRSEHLGSIKNCRPRLVAIRLFIRIRLKSNSITRVLRQDNRVLLIDFYCRERKRPNMTDPQHKAEAASTINHAAWIGYFLGPVFLLITLLTDPPAGMPQAAWLAVGLTLL